MPPVSVVIPCFNAARYVVAAVDSVRSQSDCELEIIVVDDGSSDDSASLLRRMHPDIVVVTQANAGVAAARNHGIRLARHPWIAFLDADDIWLPGKLAAQFEALEAEPLARMAYGAWEVWPCTDPVPSSALLEDLRKRSTDSGLWSGPSGWIYPQLLLDCEVWTSTVLMHRSLIDEIGNFDTSLRIGEDYDLWLRASRVTPILRVAKPLTLYRMHPASITQAPPAENYRGRVVSRAIARWGYTAQPGGSANPRDVRRALAASWSQFAASHLVSGGLSQARQGSLESLRSDPWHLRAWAVLAKSLTRSILRGVT